MSDNPLCDIDTKEVARTLRERKTKLTEGLLQYVLLIKRFQTEENASQCEKFQTKYEEFFKLKRRSKPFRDAYYKFMHENMGKSLRLKTVLERLSDNKTIKETK